jgi:site-specific DNA-methyltransferase (adenine-specific)
MTSPLPYFDDGRIRLYCGDFREVLPALALDPGAVDLVVTDPPYGETALEWDVWPEGWPAFVESYAPSMWCFGSMRMFLEHWSEFRGWRFGQEIVWRKHNGSGPTVDRFRRIHELALHVYRGRWDAIYHETPTVPGIARPSALIRAQGSGPHLNPSAITSYAYSETRVAPSVIDAPSMQRRAINGTEKPRGVVEPLVIYGCPPGGLVLDPFAGSCSTLLAARALGRRGIGIELREEQCEAAVRERLAQDVLDLEGA